jgi:hypothetical protein
MKRPKAGFALWERLLAAMNPILTQRRREAEAERKAVFWF